MAFPTTLTNAQDGVTDVLATHINAVEAKIGIDGSAVTSSHDYKLSEVTGSDKAVGETATQTLTNKTLTSPTITGATLTTSTLTSPTITSPTLTTPVVNGAVTGTMTPPLTFYASNFNAPEGFLLNGKIVPSVASNNLTVAIKGMDGNDPSASNPVYIRIGDTVRAITAALSVTKNAGTNWCNAGSSELATKEIDYFVYIGYNATDGVVVGFSRIPYATLYSDFSATTTNEKYCAISTITNAAAGDNYRNIGRFAATLSAGAGYTWSVPSFTAKNLVQRPVFESNGLRAFTPTVVGFSGSPTVSYANYVMAGRFVRIYVNISGTSNANNFTATLPFTNASQQTTTIINGADNSNWGTRLAFVNASSGTLAFGQSMSGGYTSWTTSGAKIGVAEVLISL